MSAENTCPACQLAVGPTQPTIKAGSNKYHKDHFRCSVCNMLLIGKPFFQAEDMTLFCAPDYENSYLPKCRACEKPITDEFMMMDDDRFHRACFTCHKCQGELDESHRVLDDKALCEGCYTTTLEKCAACGEPIDGETMHVGEVQYHPACLKCGVCAKVLTERYFDIDGKPHCHDCQRNLRAKACAACEKPIPDDYYADIDGNQFHFDCFRCAVCAGPLLASGKPNAYANVYRHESKQSRKYECESCHDRADSAAPNTPLQASASGGLTESVRVVSVEQTAQS